MIPLIQLITNSIAPGTWRVIDRAAATSATGPTGWAAASAATRGGDGADVAQPIGSITPFILSISLIIRHTAEVHEDVADLLRQLRRLQDLQVSIEVRFITVSDDFFEQIGVDFDFNIQSNAVGKHTPSPCPTRRRLCSPSTRRSTPAAPAVAPAATAPAAAPPADDRRHHRRRTTPAARRRRHRRRRRRRPAAAAAAAAAASPAAASPAAAAASAVPAASAAAPAAAAPPAAAPAAAASTPAYIVNPIRDHSLGNGGPRSSSAPAARGIGNFTPDLRHPLHPGQRLADRPVQRRPGGRRDLRHLVPERPGSLPLPHRRPGRHPDQHRPGPQDHTFNGADGDHQQHRRTVLRRRSSSRSSASVRSPSSRPRPRSTTASPCSVTPVVSADRRYVRMTLTPNFKIVTGLQTFPVPAASAAAASAAGRPRSTARSSSRRSPTPTHHDRHRPRRRHRAARRRQAAPRGAARVRRAASSPRRR